MLGFVDKCWEFFVALLIDRGLSLTDSLMSDGSTGIVLIELNWIACNYCKKTHETN